jgi:hypothetical protein
VQSSPPAIAIAANETARHVWPTNAATLAQVSELRQHEKQAAQQRSDRRKKAQMHLRVRSLARYPRV